MNVVYRISLLYKFSLWNTNLHWWPAIFYVKCWSTVSALVEGGTESGFKVNNKQACEGKQRVVLHFFTLSPETITTNASKDRQEGGANKLCAIFGKCLIKQHKDPVSQNFQTTLCQIQRKWWSQEEVGNEFRRVFHPTGCRICKER